VRAGPLVAVRHGIIPGFVEVLAIVAVLAPWMIGDAMSAGTWAAAAICIAAMPIFGSMSAAAYWLMRAL
jgi:hypothetical protein